MHSKFDLLLGRSIHPLAGIDHRLHHMRHRLRQDCARHLLSNVDSSVSEGCFAKSKRVDASIFQYSMQCFFLFLKLPAWPFTSVFEARKLPCHNLLSCSLDQDSQHLILILRALLLSYFNLRSPQGQHSSQRTCRYPYHQQPRQASARLFRRLPSIWAQQPRFVLW